jgi:integrase
MALNKLSLADIRNATEPGRYGDGGGLWLQISPSKTQSWLFRYTLDSRAREMGLGAVHTVNVSQARQLATDCRALLLKGIDPIDERDAQQAAVKQARAAAAAKLVTFKDAAERYIAVQGRTWVNQKHAAQWPSTLAEYVYPIFGAVNVADVDTGMVRKAVEPIWGTKTETARRVLSRIALVLDYAKANSWRDGDNPARLKGHFQLILGDPSTVQEKRNQPALPYDLLPEFMTELATMPGNGARALEFLVHTASRTDSVLGAKWPEIDFDKRIWTVPPERMKGRKGRKREHVVPLTDAAISILKVMPRMDGSDFIFGGRGGGSISNMTMLKVLQRMQERTPGRWVDPKQDNAPIVPHGFRATFDTWASNETSHDRMAIDAALAHVLSDKVMAAYSRGDWLQKRRQLMAHWSAYATSAEHGVIHQFGAVA